MIYFYIFLAVAVFVYDWIFSAKQDDEYERNFIAYMKGDLERYFEVKYIKKQYLIYILMTIPVGFACIEKSKSTPTNGWLFLIFAILFFTLPSIYFIYKSMQKIVYDQGQITYYLGNRVRVTGNIYEVDKESTFVYEVGEGTDQRVSLITFNSGEKIYFTRDTLDYGYKLEALIKKKDLGTDEYLELLEELYAEDPEDMDLLEELEIARKGYDESRLKD